MNGKIQVSDSQCHCITLKGKLNTGIREVPIEGGFDYNNAINKPSINNVELGSGNHTLEDLGIQPKGDYVDKSTYDTKVEELDRAIEKTKNDLQDNYTDTKTLEQDYAKKTEIPSIDGFIKKDVAELDNFYDKNTIDTKVNDLENKNSETDTKAENIKKDLADNYYNKTQIDTKMTSAIKYKGEVENYSDLEALQDNAENGDCYNITNASEYNKAGDNAVWNKDQQQWDILSGVVDLSDYYKSTQVNAKIDEETSDLLKTLSRELKTPDESGFSSQTIVNVKNKSGATETIMEIDNLDVETDVPVNSVLGTQKGLEFEERIKALEKSPIPIIEMIANISQEDMKAHNLPQLTLDEEQIKTIVNNNVSILKVKYNVAKTSGTETDTMVFYTTIDDVESSNGGATVKNVKINAIRTNDEADIIYHGELLGNGETYGTNVPLTAQYIEHISMAKVEALITGALQKAY